MMTPDAHTHLSCLPGERRRDFCFPCCVCSAHSGEWEKLARASEQYPHHIIPSFGIHPWHVDEHSSVRLHELPALLEQFPHAGVGETGLDHTRNAKAPLSLQQEILEAQIHLAMKKDRAITLHCVKAWGKLIESLERLRPSRVLVHGWRGPVELMGKLIDLGCFFSIGSNSFSSENNEHILHVPTNRLLVESDEQCCSAAKTAERLIALRQDMSPTAIKTNFDALFRYSGGEEGETSAPAR